jgi:hypothetical protein
MSPIAQYVSAPKGNYFSRRHPTTASKSVSVYIPSPEDFLASFSAVLNRWRKETKFFSDPQQIMNHPSFVALVKNADVVIPTICQELRSKPSNLVWVLEEFYGFDPYVAGDEGDVKKQSNRWLDYFENNG